MDQPLRNSESTASHRDDATTDSALNTLTMAASSRPPSNGDDVPLISEGEILHVPQLGVLC